MSLASADYVACQSASLPPSPSSPRRLLAQSQSYLLARRSGDCRHVHRGHVRRVALSARRLCNVGQL